jgi:hypothetical protein
VWGAGGKGCVQTTENARGAHRRQLSQCYPDRGEAPFPVRHVLHIYTLFILQGGVRMNKSIKSVTAGRNTCVPALCPHKPAVLIFPFGLLKAHARAHTL